MRGQRKMKFNKKYEEYMILQRQSWEKNLAGLGFKPLKKILKICREHRPPRLQDGSVVPHDCSACDSVFFPRLLDEMRAVEGFFTKEANGLLKLHGLSLLSRGFTASLIVGWFKYCIDQLQGRNNSETFVPIVECSHLLTYGVIHAVAMRKILKKYDKVHDSKQGQIFLYRAQSSHRIDILQSPWLRELMALDVNLRKQLVAIPCAPESPNNHLQGQCSLVLNDGKPSLSLSYDGSVKLDIDLTCSICLETVFDPVCLWCGHILCDMCACKAATVSIVDGLKAANNTHKCPVCREGGVFEVAIHLKQLHILLRRRCPEYWEERRSTENKERVQQIKEHWESQCRMFTGV